MAAKKKSINKKKSTAKLTPKPGWLKKKEMAASLDISLTAFEKWNVEPVAVIGSSRYFTVGDVLENRLDHQQKKHEKQQPNNSDTDSEDYFRERTRLTMAQAEGQEIKNKVSKRELAPYLLLELCLSKVSEEIGAILDALVPKIKIKAPHLKVIELENIKREIIKAKNTASRVQLDFDEFEEFMQ